MARYKTRLTPILRDVRQRVFDDAYPVASQLEKAIMLAGENEVLLKRAEASLGWMVEDMTYRNNETYRDGDYSPQLKEAMAVLEEIRTVNNAT